MKKEFKGEYRAIEALNLSESEWKRLGYLANRQPLKQGRHRGQQVDDSRDATRAELEEARAIARAMIEAYYRYIELGN